MTTSMQKTWIALTIAAALSGAVLAGASAANAGTCPSGKQTTDGQKAGATAHKDVSEELLGQIDLSQEKVAVAGHHLRMRRLDIKPGGEVAWHSHSERPALIYVVSGAVTEYSSACTVPIEHKAGELSIEQGGLSHWWKNNTKQSVVLLSADVAQDPKAPGM